MKRKHISGIYLVTCLRPGRLPVYYIGQSIDLHRRLLSHASCLRAGRHHNRWLQHLWNRCGKECFTFTIMGECEVGDLDATELWLLTEAIGSRNCCNIGTDPAAPMRGRKFSAEHRGRIAAGHTGENHYSYGKPLRDEHRAKISAGGRGVLRTAETKARISAANLGEKNSMFGVCGKRNARSRPVEGVNLATGEIIAFESANIAEKSGFDQGRITHCCRGNAKTHGGHTWRYATSA